MMRAVIYTWSFCGFCVRAKQILDRHGIPYEEHVMDGRIDALVAVKARYRHPTVPIILLDGRFIGGCQELETLERTGRLEGAAT
jgi:glutaredoxin 3